MKLGNIDRARHEGLLGSKRAAELSVMIVGCGAVGSWTALVMGKMGFRKFTLVDYDMVEDVNVSVQAFGALAIGDSKVKALRDTLVRDVELEDGEVVLVEDKFTGEVAKKVDVCVASMDNIKGRQEVWEAMREKCKLFVDPRMGAQFLEVHAVEKGDERGVEEDKKVIYPKSEEFTEEPCSEKAIAYTAAMAGAQVANMVRQWAVGEKGRIKVFMYDIVQGRAWTEDPEKMMDVEKRLMAAPTMEEKAAAALTKASPKVRR
jgi:molybdopterin/thiamine biosynthesis adenylyltransferase